MKSAITNPWPHLTPVFIRLCSEKRGGMKSKSVLLMFFCTVALNAQSPDTLWTRTYGGPGFEYARSLDQTTDGGYIIAGGTQPLGSDRGDVYIVKTDSLGDTLWTKVHGDPNMHEWRPYIQQTIDGGYIFVVSQYISDTVYDTCDIVLMKLDSLGDTLWTKIYGGSEAEFAGSVQQTSDSGYIIVGHIDSYAGSDIWLLKTDEDGDTSWTRKYDRALIDAGTSVQQTIDHGYIIAGYTSFGPDSGDVYLIKTNSIGDTMWTKTYGGFRDDWATSVKQTFDGGYIIGANSNSFGLGYYDDDAYLIKTDALGETLWTKTYGGNSDEHLRSAIQTSDYGYIFAGNTYSFGAGGEDVWLVKTDSIGDTLWTKIYGGAYMDGAACIQQCIDSSYITTGYTQSFGAGYYDIWLLKISSETGVEEEKANSIVSYEFGATIISGPLQLPQGKSYKIFDITGREVEIQHLKPGIYFVKVDGSIAQKIVKVR